MSSTSTLNQASPVAQVEAQVEAKVEAESEVGRGLTYLAGPQHRVESGWGRLRPGIQLYFDHHSEHITV